MDSKLTYLQVPLIVLQVGWSIALQFVVKR